jgi:6-pyruvoyltetrahydropterin/6-carboxytetrahydropterin synthase
MLHGHNGRIHFTVAAASLDAVGGELDSIGRVLDFSVIGSRLCDWLERNWDHRFLVWEHDPWWPTLRQLDVDGVVVVPFNPTAEQMAKHLVEVVAPEQLHGTNCELIACRVEETRKCSAEYC